MSNPLREEMLPARSASSSAPALGTVPVVASVDRSSSVVPGPRCTSTAIAPLGCAVSSRVPSPGRFAVSALTKAGRMRPELSCTEVVPAAAAVSSGTAARIAATADDERRQGSPAREHLDRDGGRAERARSSRG